MENIFPFLFLGAVYSLTGPSITVARLHFLIFFLCRVLHSIAYLFALRAPTRSVSYSLAQIPCFSMAVQILMAVSTYAWFTCGFPDSSVMEDFFMYLYSQWKWRLLLFFFNSRFCWNGYTVVISARATDACEQLQASWVHFAKPSPLFVFTHSADKSSYGAPSPSCASTFSVSVKTFQFACLTTCWVTNM